MQQTEAEKRLHILSGSALLEKWKEAGAMEDDAEYIPFNEAMCWGETDREIFSEAFVQKRLAAHQTTLPKYQKTVLEPLEPLFQKDFDSMILRFGTDIFCQKNLLTVLAYLEQNGFEGNVLLRTACGRAEEVFSAPAEIGLGGYHTLYEAVLCRRRLPDTEMPELLRQAAERYLTYRGQSSPIMAYIRAYADCPDLVRQLLERFPEYGLGDFQYESLIRQAKSSRME